MRLRPSPPAARGSVAAAALVCAACGAATASSASSSSPTASSTAAPTLGPAAPAPPSSAAAVPTATSLANVTPTPQPTLQGVHYIVPPGWRIAAMSVGDARLTTDSGLTIELKLADGSPSLVTRTNGRPVQVDGETGYEADARAASVYRDQIDIAHAGHMYDVVCTSPDPTDRQTTVDICEGFAYGMTWTR